MQFSSWHQVSMFEEQYVVRDEDVMEGNKLQTAKATIFVVECNALLYVLALGNCQRDV